MATGDHEEHAAIRRSGPRGRTLRRIAQGLLFVALIAGLFGLLPQLGGLARDAAGLRHARPAFIGAAIAAQAASLGSYAQLYRSVLASLRARVSFALSARVTLASFLVSHLTPFGSVTGSLVNVDALESAGIQAATTGEGIALTTLVSTIALIALFCAGLAVTAGQHLSTEYIMAAAIALLLAGSALAAVIALGAHPTLAGKAGRRAGGLVHRVHRGTDPARTAEQWTQLAALARSALTGRALLTSFGFASADLLLDLLSLGLMFGALGYQPGFGPLAVAYAAANIASVIPVTPAGLGVIEVTLVAITVGFGAPRATAVLAVLGYRLVNYWLPLPAGAVAYLRLKLGAGSGRGTSAPSPAGQPAPAGGQQAPAAAQQAPAAAQQAPAAEPAPASKPLPDDR